MPAKITFYPLGNADTTLIRLADSRLVLVDFANMCDPSDEGDKRCDLPAKLRCELADADKTDFAVVCFTHLDEDHVKGMKEFFWLESLKSSQEDGRPKIKELWVPAAAITETGIAEELEDAKAVRREARCRLKAGKRIKVFSRPDALKSWLEGEGLTIEERKNCIVDAGQPVPGFTLDGPEAVEFFVHSPFAWRTDDRGVEDRNQDSIVFQTTFREGGEDTYVLFGSDVESDTLSQIVKTTKTHRREKRLLWDVLKLFHHCSYKTLDKDNKDKNKTVPVPEVKWLIEDRGGESCIIVSPSKPIPKKGTKEDEDPQPPHRQAANYYKGVMETKAGKFLVTMEHPEINKPEPIIIEIKQKGPVLSGGRGSAGGMITGGGATLTMTQKGKPGGNFA